MCIIHGGGGPLPKWLKGDLSRKICQTLDDAGFLTRNCHVIFLESPKALGINLTELLKNFYFTKEDKNRTTSDLGLAVWLASKYLNMVIHVLYLFVQNADRKAGAKEGLYTQNIK